MDFEQEYNVGNWYSTGASSTQKSSWNWSNLDFGAIGGGIGAIAGGIQSGKAGKLAQQMAYANAADMLQLAGENAARVGQIAGINASAIRNTGYAQAAATRQASYMTGQLMIIEGTEAMRRQLNEERYHIGLLRVMQSPSGWSINEGTPREVVVAQKNEGEQRRKYTALQQEMSLFAMLMNAELQASVTEYSADQQADALLMSASIEQEMLMAEANMRYAAMIREGDYYYQLGKLKKKSGFGVGIGTIAGAVAGSFIPGVGTAAGATIGGAAGGILYS